MGDGGCSRRARKRSAPGRGAGWQTGLVRALVTDASIEAFDEAILHRFSWRDIVPCDLAILLAFQDGVR